MAKWSGCAGAAARAAAAGDWRSIRKSNSLRAVFALLPQPPVITEGIPSTCIFRRYIRTPCDVLALPGVAAAAVEASAAALTGVLAVAGPPSTQQKVPCISSDCCNSSSLRDGCGAAIHSNSNSAPWPTLCQGEKSRAACCSSRSNSDTSIDSSSRNTGNAPHGTACSSCSNLFSNTSRSTIISSRHSKAYSSISSYNRSSGSSSSDPIRGKNRRNCTTPGSTSSKNSHSSKLSSRCYSPNAVSSCPPSSRSSSWGEKHCPASDERDACSSTRGALCHANSSSGIGRCTEGNSSSVGHAPGEQQRGCRIFACGSSWLVLSACRRCSLLSGTGSRLELLSTSSRATGGSSSSSRWVFVCNSWTTPPRGSSRLRWIRSKLKGSCRKPHPSSPIDSSTSLPCRLRRHNSASSSACTSTAGGSSSRSGGTSRRESSSSSTSARLQRGRDTTCSSRLEGSTSSSRLRTVVELSSNSEAESHVWGTCLSMWMHATYETAARSCKRLASGSGPAAPNASSSCCKRDSERASVDICRSGSRLFHSSSGSTSFNSSGRCFPCRSSSSSGPLLLNSTSLLLQHVARSPAAAADARRFVRTGFFRSDEAFIEPEDVLFAEAPDRLHRHGDGGGELSAEVVERSNVGMGVCMLNSSSTSEGWLTMKTLCALYRKLRDLEVNSLKRFVLLYSYPTAPCFSAGFDLRELLFLAELAQQQQDAGGKKKGSSGRLLPLVAVWQLRNLSDCMHLLFDFYKPLVVLLNSSARAAGASLCFLANRSAAYTQASFTCDTTMYGWIPDGGLSYVLSKLRGSLGIYLALTGHTLRGADLVWSGLCKYWMSPEALPLLELTAEKQLEVSERDAAVLLEEHFLTPPDTYSLDEWEEIIDDHFGVESLTEAKERLATTARQRRDSSSERPAATWARAVLHRLHDRSSLAAEITFKLLRSLKEYRQEILREGGITGSEWNRIKKTSYIVPLSFLEDSRKQIYEAVEERVFQRALTLETRAALRLLAGSPDLINRLRYHLTGGQLAKGSSVPSLSCTRVDEKAVVSHYFQPLPNSQSAAGAAAKDDSISFAPSCAFFFPTVEFSSQPRSGFPLSAHPLLRRLHPDFDNATGYDYDPYSMRKLEMRWSYTLFLQERVQALKLVKHSY